MLTKKRLLWMIFWAPGAVGARRIGLTVWFLVSNPLGMPLRFIQLVPLIALGVSLFMYYKLYQDGVPVISLIAPSLLHAVIIFVFQKIIVIPPFAVILILDIVYLALRGVKSNSYPFDIDEEQDELDAVMELLDEAG